eukprot:GHVU01127016.1.p1 GENE.GHVU01127016.1~~GHVU01127016.1.p1  ORF type:complete len:170 (-),score=1.61 GHVU01127016.1:323-832(-)
MRAPTRAATRVCDAAMPVLSLPSINPSIDASIITGWCPPTPRNHNSGRSVGSDMHPSCMQSPLSQPASLPRSASFAELPRKCGLRGQSVCVECGGVTQRLGSVCAPSQSASHSASYGRRRNACEVAAAPRRDDGSLDPRPTHAHNRLSVRVAPPSSNEFTASLFAVQIT